MPRNTPTIAMAVLKVASTFTIGFVDAVGADDHDAVLAARRTN